MACKVFFGPEASKEGVQRPGSQDFASLTSAIKFVMQKLRGSERTGAWIACDGGLEIKYPEIEKRYKVILRDEQGVDR